MDKKNNIFIFIFLLSVFSAVHLYFYMPAKNSPFAEGFSAVNGAIDLQFWHSDEHLLELEGDWEFYYNRLIQPYEFSKWDESQKVYSYVPCSWERTDKLKLNPEGCATYRLTITGLRPGQIYGFYMYEQANAFKLWINKNLCAYNGTVSNEREVFSAEWKPVVGTFTSDINGAAEIIVQVANFNYNRGGFWNSLKIGSVANVVVFREKKIFTAIFLFTVIALASVMFFAFFIIDPKNKASLFFSLFTFFISLRIILIEERIIKNFIDLPWGLTTRIEYLSGYVLLPLFGLFILQFFKVDFRNYFLKIFSFIIIAAVILTFFAPHSVYAFFLPYYRILLVVSLPYFFYVLVVSIKRKIPGSIIALIGSVFIGVAVVRDIVTANHYTMVSFGVLIFLGCYSFLLMQKFFYLVKQKGHLEEKVNIDLLTELYNRHFFIEYVKNRIQTLNNNETFYVMFIDLDKFKKINDNYGHDAGDEVLKCIGGRLKSIFRDGDVISRFGGDEFLIFIENKTDTVITELSQRIIQTISRPIKVGENSFEVGMSIGISKFPDDGDSVEELIIMSDNLMYKAKKRGGRCSEMVTTQNYGA
ncbi:MAG: diguanylate cyclase [Spirochaetes bacterium]|nr:diguanylate cyclase [Spirochaetota bacterium]